jgi:hypothetical protein
MPSVDEFRFAIRSQFREAEPRGLPHIEIWAALSLPESPMSSSMSPVRILATRIALATVSAGRFWPCGPPGHG